MYDQLQDAIFLPFQGVRKMGCVLELGESWNRIQLFEIAFHMGSFLESKVLGGYVKNIWLNPARLILHNCMKEDFIIMLRLNFKLFYSEKLINIENSPKSSSSRYVSDLGEQKCKKYTPLQPARCVFDSGASCNWAYTVITV